LHRNIDVIIAFVGIDELHERSEWRCREHRRGELPIRPEQPDRNCHCPHELRLLEADSHRRTLSITDRTVGRTVWAWYQRAQARRLLTTVQVKVLCNCAIQRRVHMLQLLGGRDDARCDSFDTWR